MAVFESKAAFDAAYPPALAVWCSDGRFTRSVEELLASLGEERLDTLTMPGGPALLDTTSAGVAALDTVREAASFLIKAHATKSVVLVAHSECGYYRSRYRYESAEAMLRRQLADLRGASRHLTTTHAGLRVRCFYASVAEGGGPHVRFDPIELLATGR